MKQNLCIIIPAYNAAETIADCLSSIIGQDYEDMHIIVVDDGSTDNSLHKIKAIVGNDSRFEVLHKENGGLSDARNFGLDRADSEYIMFVDADDELTPGTIGRMMDIMRSHPDYDILEFSIIGKRALSLDDKVYDDVIEYWYHSKAYIHTYACNKVYRKHLFDNVRYPKGEVFEDVATLPKILRHAKRIATTSSGFYHYKYNAEGITEKAGGKEWRQLLNHHIKAMELIGGNRCDAEYLMHIVDCQIMVSELTGDKPIMQFEMSSTAGLSLRHKIKAMLIITFGIDKLCMANRLFRKVFKRS